MKIELVIDELVLHGFDPRQRHAIGRDRVAHVVVVDDVRAGIDHARQRPAIGPDLPGEGLWPVDRLRAVARPDGPSVLRRLVRDPLEVIDDGRVVICRAAVRGDCGRAARALAPRGASHELISVEGEAIAVAVRRCAAARRRADDRGGRLEAPSDPDDTVARLRVVVKPDARLDTVKRRHFDRDVRVEGTVRVDLGAGPRGDHEREHEHARSKVHACPRGTIRAPCCAVN